MLASYSGRSHAKRVWEQGYTKCLISLHKCIYLLRPPMDTRYMVCILCIAISADVCSGYQRLLTTVLRHHSYFKLGLEIELRDDPETIKSLCDVQCTDSRDCLNYGILIEGMIMSQNSMYLWWKFPWNIQ